MYQEIIYPPGLVDLDKNQFYPADPANTDYQNIMKEAEEGKVIILPPDKPAY